MTQDWAEDVEMEWVFRLGVGVILFSNLLISGFFRRKAREETGAISRREEGVSMLLIRALFGLALFGGFLAYLIHPAWISWARLPLPEGARFIALAMAAACAPLLIWMFRAIGANISETALVKRDHQLVTDGPYRWIRHPLYAIGGLLLLSLSLAAGNWFMLALSFLAILLIQLVVVPKEEAELVRRFGEEYEAYRERTGRIWPKFGTKS